MPLYTISTQAGALSPDMRGELAARITDFHCRMADVSRDLVKIVFDTYSPGEAFVAGEPAPAVILTVLIRAGRSADYKRSMLLELWTILQRATGAAEAQMLVGLQELPASQAMEMGRILPDLATGPA